MADPIDPRLFASSLPPRQAYTAAPQHSAGHPYYHQQPPHLAQPAPLGAALDPALETSPTGPEESPEEYEHEDDDGDHDGCAIHAALCDCMLTCTQPSRNAGVCQIHRRQQAAPRMRLVSRTEGVYSLLVRPELY
jgi:hypothetical protein